MNAAVEIGGDHSFAEELQTVAAAALDAIIVLDDGAQIVFWNHAAERIFGYSAADAMGRNLHTLVAPERFYADFERAYPLFARTGTGRLIGKVVELAAIRRDGSEFPIEVSYASVQKHGRWWAVGVVRDITERERAKEEIRLQVIRLKQTLQSTIDVVSAIGELRDPYTHGHERRVGDLAAAIGTKLGLGAERVEGLRISGYLHDVGKIGVPSEILAKPTRLAAAEMELVKTHAEYGYEILNRIEFPWPVAEVARQHHERIDGSGYPRGLKGEEIIPEARIIGVADTVEATSSHRPYRPGHGINVALAEIEKGRGSQYDVQTADACLHLFRADGYTLPA